MEITEAERNGIGHFLNSQEGDNLAMTMCQVISRNLIKPSTIEDAISVICQHSTSSHSILNRKAITKEILYKYLHANKISLGENVTKQSLIERVIQFWNNNTTNNHSQLKETNLPQGPISNPSEFPIEQLSLTFCEWFFQNYNKNEIKPIDFWTDVRLQAVVTNVSQQFNRQEISEGNEETVQILQHLRHQFNIYFHPNICADGVRGLMNPNGLVMILCCGTIYVSTNDDPQWAGTFECAFGLLQDPFTANNWKIKQIRLQLKIIGNTGSLQAAYIPTISQCDSFNDLLPAS